MSASRTALVFLGVVAIFLAACSEAEPSGVASLSDTTSTSVAAESDGTDPLLAFSECMRQNGIDDFEDPIVDADGKVLFPSKAKTDDWEAFDTAMAVCGSFLEGTVFGAEKSSSESIEAVDDLVELAQCMRDNGFDMPDPDGEGQFEEFDKSSQEFESAYEECSGALGAGSGDK